MIVALNIDTEVIIGRHYQSEHAGTPRTDFLSHLNHRLPLGSNGHIFDRLFDLLHLLLVLHGLAFELPVEFLEDVRILLVELDAIGQCLTPGLPSHKLIVFFDDILSPSGHLVVYVRDLVANIMTVEVELCNISDDFHLLSRVLS